MSVMTRFIERARGRQGRVVFPEGHDERIVRAARELVEQQVARPIVLGKRDVIETLAVEHAISLDGIEIVNPPEWPKLNDYAADYARRRHMEGKIAMRLVRKPPVFGGMLVAQGDADTMVAGVEHATATVIQAAVLTVGYAPGIRTVSSFFLMVLPAFEGRSEVPLMFADCGVNIQPTAEQLADIALSTYATAERLMPEPPRLAMLSFSTLGTAAHDDVHKVTRALELARQRRPDAAIDGEFQADAALVSRVAAKKVKRESAVAGRANVLVFPDLDSGNIAYKLTQYLAGARAFGPVLQGFASPVSDLSRGATADDIVATSLICLAQL